MSPYLLGFNCCLLLAAFLWFLLKVMEKDRRAAAESRIPKPQRRWSLTGLAQFKWLALWLAVTSWIAFRNPDKPKPQADYYGNPNWWAQVQASEKPAQWSEHAALDAPDPIYVPPDKAGAARPNPQLTPGWADPSLSAKELCNSHFHTKAIRDVDDSTKQKVCQEYGVQPSDCNGKTLEIDHLISLELGGSNDPRNLWPQYYKPKPGAHEKDKVENWLHKEVCSGLISLPEAQREISTDWYGVWLRMPKKSPHPRQQ